MTPKDFLWWLITSADQGRLVWPGNGSIKFGTTTQKMRENLFGKRGLNACLEAKKLALAELERAGTQGSRRRWWAFEGFNRLLSGNR
jgi:hypothetical protein